MRTSARLLWLGVVAGCAGGAGSASAPAPIEPVSIATTPTDHRLVTLTPAPLGGGTEALDQAITSYYERATTRRSYLQTDKPLYQPGETVWFRADVRATGTLRGGQPLGLTFQLVSPRGAVVTTKRVLAQDGVARNDLPLAGDLEGGEYKLVLQADDGTRDERRLVVNTYQAPRLQKSLELLRKAYGAGDAVAAALELKRATGEAFAAQVVTAVVTVDDAEVARLPVTTDRDGKALVRFTLPATMARGDGLLTVLADDGGVTESIQKRIPIVMTSLQLGLYPEGGDLVDTVPGRVYVMARSLIGKPADVEGQVLDDRGQVVTTFRTIHDGLGRFELTPATDRRYHVAITRPAGITSTFAVPAAAPGGCVIRSVDQAGADTLRVGAICNTSRRLVVEAVLREQRVGGGSVDVVAGEPVLIEVPVDATRQGVVRVTLFSAAHAPLAERLVYHGRGAELRVSITADRQRYTPRDPVTLKIKTTDASGRPVPASLGLAVVDETVLAYADDRQASILARVFLEPELGVTPEDPIEEPDYYLSDKPDAAAALDALLATRGYRRFEWRPIVGALGGS
ncbi:MAG: MG2 domain-containing protein [Kofleriaceae bacterium]